jgi:tRNA 5-methylaminomethyl-2-thiouridine biosynthesis bifunctional protein
LAGYVISGLASGVCIGATYDNDTNPLPTQSSQQENVTRLKRLLPDWNGIDAQQEGGSETCLARSNNLGSQAEAAHIMNRVGFRAVSQDRLPIVGSLPTHEGLYALMGLGSRGLVLGGLCAELLAARLNGEPVPLEIELAEALSPQRFSPR